MKLTVNGKECNPTVCPVEGTCSKRRKHECDGQHPHKDCPLKEGVTFKLVE